MITNTVNVSREGRSMTTKTLVYCAVFAALSVVLKSLFGLMPNESTRFSIDSVPVILAGILFGPLAGALVGFSADFVGCMFSAYGYNPIFCIPSILYGLIPGLMRRWLGDTPSIPKLTAMITPPVVFGSILYQSAALALMYYKDGPFLQGFLYYLTSRGIQFAVILVIDVALVYLLFKARLFHRIGLWPRAKKQKGDSAK